MKIVFGMVKKLSMIFLFIVFIGIVEETAMPKFSSDKDVKNDFLDSGDTEMLQSIHKEIVATENVSFDLNEAAMNTFLINKSDWHLMFSHKMFTKSEFCFGTAEQGIASLNIIIRMESGNIYEVQRKYTDLSFQQIFSVPVIDDKIEDISVIVEWNDCLNHGEVYELKNSKDFDILSANTIKAKETGILLCLDKYCNVLDSISIEKGGEFLINTDTYYYEVIMEDT